MTETPKAITWPTLQVGSEVFTLRYSYSSNYMLAKWGKALDKATNIELAAAMCGKFDARGKWKSTGFENAIELADLIADLPPEEQKAAQDSLVAGVTDALKKAFPELEIILKTIQPGAMQETKEPSDSGPSPHQEAA